MTWDMSRRDGPFCEGCEAVHKDGRACPGCGTKTCRRCGWCCEHADWTVTVAAEPAVPAEVPVLPGGKLARSGTIAAYVIAASPSAPFPGWYLKDVGSVDAHWTPEPGEAMRFPSSAAAMTFWNSVPPGLGAYFPVQIELVTVTAEPAAPAGNEGGR